MKSVAKTGECIQWKKCFLYSLGVDKSQNFPLTLENKGE